MPNKTIPLWHTKIAEWIEVDAERGPRRDQNFVHRFLFFSTEKSVEICIKPRWCCENKSVVFVSTPCHCTPSHCIQYAGGQLSSRQVFNNKMPSHYLASALKTTCCAACKYKLKVSESEQFYWRFRLSVCTQCDVRRLRWGRYSQIWNNRLLNVLFCWF